MTTSKTHRSLDGILPDKAVGGLVLVAIGLVIIASYLIPGFGEYALLTVGIVCLIAFAMTREYGLAVAAGIVTGMGVGVVLTTVATDPSDGVAFLIAFAAGFASVWVLGLFADPRETNPWPLVPAALFAAVAVTVASGSSILLDAVVVVSVIALIAGGVKALREARKEA